MTTGSWFGSWLVQKGFPSPKSPIQQFGRFFLGLETGSSFHTGADSENQWSYNITPLNPYVALETKSLPSTSLLFLQSLQFPQILKHLKLTAITQGKYQQCIGQNTLPLSTGADETCTYPPVVLCVHCILTQARVTSVSKQYITRCPLVRVAAMKDNRSANLLTTFPCCTPIFRAAQPCTK